MLLGRARGTPTPADIEGIKATVKTEKFRASLGRIACGFDGGQIIDER